MTMAIIFVVLSQKLITENMKKLIPITLLLVNGICFAQDITIKKGLGWPMQVEISGSVPNWEEASVCENANQAGKTIDDSQKTKGLYLGVTVIVNGEEKDFPVHVVRGRFKETYTLSAYSMVSSGGGDMTWVAALWRGRQNRDCCAAFNSSPCEYCRKNGYHLTNRIARNTLEYDY